jgi:uncharacterized protein YndB with AHSA1/START domain
MVDAQNTVTINAPQADVFAFLADGTNNPKWRTGVASINHAKGDGVGAVYSQKVKGPGGREIDADYEITAYDPPRRLAFKAIAGPARPEGEFVLEPEGPSTRVTFKLWWEPKGLKRAMAPMVAKTMKSEVAALEKLKELLERA